MAIQPTNPIIRIAENDVNLPSTGQPNKNEPSPPLQITGYDNDQVVTAEELNYIFDNFGEWLKYLNGVTEDTTFTAGDGVSLSSTELNTDITISVDNTIARSSTTITAGEGLTGGGDLSQSRVLDLGTPSSLDGSTTNTTTEDSHTHELNMASQAESETGTDNDKLVTPLRVHQAIPFTFSPSSINGSTESTTLPNGLIIKWGETPSVGDGNTTNVTFTTPFPNACFHVGTEILRDVSGDGPKAYGTGTTNITASGVTISFNGSGRASSAIGWWAIGY